MSERFIVFDVECTLDPQCPADPPKNPDMERVPAPPHHMVVSCAVLMFTWAKEESGRTLVAANPRLLGDKAGTESSILKGFANLMRDRPVLVSWNGRGFDIPVILARSFRSGIPAPWLWDRDVMDRYRGHMHIDLQEHMTNYGAGRAAKMAAFAKLVGWPGKLGVTGSDVPELWLSGDDGKARVRRYNLEDVGCQAAIFLRLMFMKGVLSLEEYQRSCESLLAAFDREPRFAELSSAIDRPSFLMNTPSEPASTAEHSTSS